MKRYISKIDIIDTRCSRSKSSYRATKGCLLEKASKIEVLGAVRCALCPVWGCSDGEAETKIDVVNLFVELKLPCFDGICYTGLLHIFTSNLQTIDGKTII